MTAPIASDQSAREYELSILYEIASIAKYADSLERVIELCLDKASRLLGSEIAVFYLLSPERGRLEARAARGVRLKRVAPTVQLDGEQDTQLTASAKGWDGLCNPLDGQYPLRAALGLPLRHSGGLLGWLFVGRLRRESFAEHELALYTALGEQAAGALHLTLAWERQREQQATLEAANGKLAQLLADLSAASQQQEQLIETIRALSTPVLALDDQVLLIPLIGLIDTARAALIQQRMLEAIAGSTAQVTILDISGVAAVDEMVVTTLIRTTQAAQLLGATVIICGISPEVAQVMVGLGIERQISTAHSLRTAVDRAFRLAGRGLGRQQAGV